MLGSEMGCDPSPVCEYSMEAILTGAKDKCDCYFELELSSRTNRPDVRI
jgi:hypothetical protein